MYHIIYLLCIYTQHLISFMQKYAFLINNSLALLSYYVSQQPYKTDTIIPIFQMRKLMHRG